MQLEENVLSFKWNPSEDGAEVYVDLAKAWSQVNRKLKRQNGLHYVSGVCVHVPAPAAADVTISGSARTWVTRNAIVKAFSLWKKQQAKAYEASGSSIRPKWQDFKVWLNEGHRSGTTLTPTAGHMFGGTDEFTDGEWVPSQVVIEKVVAGAVVQVEPQLHIIGNDNGTTNFGMIKQYAESRALIQSPDPVTPGGLEDSMYAQAYDALSAQVEEIVENLEDSNDEPPYDRDTYPGGSSNGNEVYLYSWASFGAASLGRKLNLPGFAVPNGLLELQSSNTGDTDIWVQIYYSHQEAY